METTLLVLIFSQGMILALALYIFVEKHNSNDMFSSRFKIMYGINALFQDIQVSALSVVHFRSFKKDLSSAYISTSIHKLIHAFQLLKEWEMNKKKKKERREGWKEGRERGRERVKEGGRWYDLNSWNIESLSIP